MDILKRDKNNQISHMLTNDHRPNPAFINEFQTNNFTLSLKSIELVEGALEGYQVEEGGMFVVMHLSIRNNTNEIIEISREDFALSYDKEEPYTPEENFKSSHQFADDFAMKPFETVNGNFVFITSASASRICFLYNENYDEDHYKLYRLRYRLS